MGRRRKRVFVKSRDTKAVSAREKVHPEAEPARKIVRAHPSVVGEVAFPVALSDGGFEIKFDMDVPLPSRASVKGISRTGVKSKEQVILLFPRAYPHKAPVVLLRPDFNKSLAHMNPILSVAGREYVSPCIYEGVLDELLHQEGDGLSEMLNQLSGWLGKAAIDDLIDPKQGWEPIRRDHVSGWTAYDLSHIRAHTKDRKGSSVFPCKVWIQRFQEENSYYLWVMDGKNVPINPLLARNSFRFEDIPYGALYWSLAILAWGDSESIVGQYLPDSVTNFHELCERAKDYHLLDALESAIANLRWALKEASRSLPRFLLSIILCVRRPCHLIGDDSSLELIPYIVDCEIKETAGPLMQPITRISEDSKVLPLAHRHKVTKQLLQKMSGRRESAKEDIIVHVGCGSVGSKIAMHLARSGYGPFKLIDRAVFSPHNVARHALAVASDIRLPKAALLAEEIKMLRLKAEGINEDVIEICLGQDENARSVLDNARLIIESTGSVAVRDALALLPAKRLPGRLMHVVLYGEGKIGITAVEGAGRNPNVNDLILQLYDDRVENEELSHSFLGSAATGRHEIGLGCGSHTMVIPDTRISLFSAGMAERAAQILEAGNDASHGGELWTGVLDKSALGVSWKLRKIGPTTILSVVAQNLWQVRILEQAVEQISTETKRWGDVETGGVLIGRISLHNRSFNVSRVIEAPPDSIRSEGSFVLGTEGLRKTVQGIYEKSGGALSYVGTWHSHPRGGGASSIDRNCLEELRRVRLGAPAVGVIWTPSGFRAIVDEGKLA